MQVCWAIFLNHSKFEVSKYNTRTVRNSLRTWSFQDLHLLSITFLLFTILKMYKRITYTLGWGGGGCGTLSRFERSQDQFPESFEFTNKHIWYKSVFGNVNRAVSNTNTLHNFRFRTSRNNLYVKRLWEIEFLVLILILNSYLH